MKCILQFRVLISMAGIMSGLAQPMVAAQEATEAPSAREVWIALRGDGQPGTGTVTDPFDGSSVEKLNALFLERFAKEFGENLTIHFGPGVYHGDRIWRPLSNWKIRGAGMDVTILRTRPNPNASTAVGFRGGECYWGEGISGVEISDMTFDFNVPALRKANRVFAAGRRSRYAEYCHVSNPPAWDPEKNYGKHSRTALHDGQDYMVLKSCKGEEPGQNKFWTPLRLSNPETMPAWQADKACALSDTVTLEGKGYICVVETTQTDPRQDTQGWDEVDPHHPDPGIYTTAAFINGRPPNGQHRVSRVKAVNGNGSLFFDREAFIIGLG